MSRNPKGATLLREISNPSKLPPTKYAMKQTVQHPSLSIGSDGPVICGADSTAGSQFLTTTSRDKPGWRKLIKGPLANTKFEMAQSGLDSAQIMPGVLESLAGQGGADIDCNDRFGKPGTDSKHPKGLFNS